MNTAHFRAWPYMVMTFFVAHFMCPPVGAQVSKEDLESISTPDRVDTSIGTLEVLDGAPYPETAEKVYDYLDTMRGVDAFLISRPIHNFGLYLEWRSTPDLPC